MATVFENRPAPAYTPPQEDAALHNALIKERYEKLKNAEATQLAESISEAERAPYAAPRAAASVLAPERPEKTAPAFTAPVPERTPLGNEVVHTKVDSPLFTPETLDRTIQRIIMILRRLKRLPSPSSPFKRRTCRLRASCRSRRCPPRRQLPLLWTPPSKSLTDSTRLPSR